MVLIQDECNNNSLACIRYSFLALVSLTIAILSTKWSYHHYKLNGSIRYEIAPMLCSCLQAIVHLVQYTIYNSNRMIISASLLQLFTFILVSQSLANLRYRFKYANDMEKRKNRYMRLLIAKGMFYAVVFTLQIWFFIKIDDHACNNYFYYSLDLLEIQILIITLFTQIHGQSLMYYIRRKEEQQNQFVDSQYSQSLEDSQLVRNTFQMKLKQIKLVIWAQTITMITFIILIIIMYNTNRELFCFQHQREQTYSIFQISIQIFFSCVQQFPCFYIPYAFYYAEKPQKVSKVTAIDFNIHEESTADHQINVNRTKSSYDDAFVNLIHSQNDSD